MSSSSSPPSLPDDMIAEILSRLPVVSIVRFKSICKTWRDIIEGDDELAEKYYQRATTSFCYQHNHVEPGTLIPTRYKTQKGGSFFCIDARKGLVLEQERSTVLGERLRVRNPATRQAVNLPVVGTYWIFAGMFFAGKSCCKVISFSQTGPSIMEGRFRAITLGVDSAWRPLNNNNNNNNSQNYSLGTPFRRFRRCKTKTMYSLSIGNVFHVINMSNNPKKILSVNTEDERCESGEIPENLFSDWRDVRPREWDSKLSLYRRDGENIDIWVLEKKNEWVKTTILVLDFPFPFVAKDAKLCVPIPGAYCRWWLHGRVPEYKYKYDYEHEFDEDDDHDYEDDDDEDDDDDDDDDDGDDGDGDDDDDDDNDNDDKDDDGDGDGEDDKNDGDDDDDDNDDDDKDDDGDGDGDGDGEDDNNDGDDDDDDEDDDDEDDAVVAIKPTILQLKGMEALSEEEEKDIEDRPYWKEEDEQIPSCQIIYQLTLILE